MNIENFSNTKKQIWSKESRGCQSQSLDTIGYFGFHTKGSNIQAVSITF